MAGTSCHKTLISNPNLNPKPYRPCHQVALVEQLVEEVWQGPAAITLNPEWSAVPVPVQYKSVRDSFQVVYSFLPVSIQVRVNAVCLLVLVFVWVMCKHLFYNTSLISIQV